MSVLDLCHLRQASLGFAYFREYLLSLFVVSKLNRCLYNPACIVLEGDFSNLSPDEFHHLDHELLRVFFGVRLEPELVPESLCLRNGFGMTTGALAFFPNLSLQCAGRQFFALVVLGSWLATIVLLLFVLVGGGVFPAR